MWTLIVPENNPSLLPIAIKPCYRIGLENVHRFGFNGGAIIIGRSARMVKCPSVAVYWSEQLCRDG